MNEVISNSDLTVEVNSFGAELAGIRDSAGTEYMWSGDPDVWSGRAPILFPIVGALRGDEYLFEDQAYSMNKHGFARRMEFEVVGQTEDSLSFRLLPTDDTRVQYPFEFELLVDYLLDGNSLKTSYAVKNKSESPMPFSIGAHPGFALSWAEHDNIEDYYLEFSEAETVDALLLDENGLVSEREVSVFNAGNVLAIRKDIFDEDALIFSGLKSDAVTLRSKTSPNSLRVEFSGFPMLGVWAKPAAPYVCIEPWYGIADSVGHNGDITSKRGVIMLDPGKHFKCVHSIVISQAMTGVEGNYEVRL